MDFNLIAAADEGLRASMSEFGAPSHWRFSDLGKCLRCQVLKRLGFQNREKRSFKSNFILQMGNVIEREALEWISRSTNVDILAKQVKVNIYQYDARGTLDALGRIGNWLAPIEVKSTRDKALEYRIPYRNHELQAGAYAWALNLPGSFLIYFGRDGATAQAWVPNNQALRDEIIEQWEKLNLYWDSVPTRLETIGDGGYQSDEYFYDSVSPFLPPAPKVIVRPVLDKYGNPQVYQRAGAWGPKGTPKTELSNDGSCTYCPYPGYCCLGGDDEVSETELALPGDLSLPGGDSEAPRSVPFSVSGGRTELREVADGRDTAHSGTGTSQESIGAPGEAWRKSQEKFWEGIPKEAIMEGPWIAESGTQAVS